MSYPKVPPKPTTGTPQKISQQRKERLQKLKEREELKGLLVNKFKKKYGDSAGFIDREVENFMKQEALTEANLKKLDEKIKKKTELDHATKEAQAAKSIPKSKQSAGSVRSQRSAASQVSNRSKASKAGSKAGSQWDKESQRELDDGMSVYSSEYSRKSSSFVPEDDDDEWAAILDYDTMLYR